MDRKSVIGGTAVVALGLLAIYNVRDLALGTPSRMGPAFFPTMLGGLLTALGLGIGASGLTWRAPEPDAPLQVSDQAMPLADAIRPLAFILASVVAFALLIGRTGLVPAVAITVLISTLASTSFSPARSLVLVVGVPAGAYLIFRAGLGLSIPAFAWNF